MIVLLKLIYKVIKILSSSLYLTVNDIWLTFARILWYIKLYINNHLIEKSIIADFICKKLDDYKQILDTFTTILIQIQNYLLFLLEINVI